METRKARCYECKNTKECVFGYLRQIHPRTTDGICRDCVEKIMGHPIENK